MLKKKQHLITLSQKKKTNINKQNHSKTTKENSKIERRKSNPEKEGNIPYIWWPTATARRAWVGWKAAWWGWRVTSRWWVVIHWAMAAYIHILRSDLIWSDLICSDQCVEGRWIGADLHRWNTSDWSSVSDCKQIRFELYIFLLLGNFQFHFIEDG